MPDTGELQYFVLAERAVPYLLAKVRWPDVAQAISAASPDWIEDPGLLEMPYAPNAVTVTFRQAASVAAGWGARLQDEVAESAMSYIRRMPANWTDLTPSERRTWGLEFVGRRSSRGRQRPRQANGAEASTHAQTNGHVYALATPPGDDGQLAGVATGPRKLVAERRDHARVRIGGHAHIRAELTTISAGLVDMSECGLRCVLPESSSLIAPGATLGGAFLIENEGSGPRICLDVTGRISWHRSTRAGTHFGVEFGELDEGETEGVRRFLAAAARRRGGR